jgi:hypothetical protein
MSTTMEEEVLRISGEPSPEGRLISERPPIVGSYDDASGPVQMKAQHIALIVYFGTYDWIAARQRGQAASAAVAPLQD